MLHLSIIGAILDYIEDYTTKIKLEFERFCKQSRFTTQKNKIMCINKFGGENNSPPKKCNRDDCPFCFIRSRLYTSGNCSSNVR